MENKDRIQNILFNGIGAIKLAKVQLENLLNGFKEFTKQDDVKSSFLKIHNVLENVDKNLQPLSELNLLPVAAQSLSKKGEHMCEVVEQERYTVVAIRSCCRALINHMEYIINDLERIRRHYYASI